MLIFKIALYSLTTVGALYCAFWEMKLKNQLTEDALKRQYEGVSDFGIFNDLSNRMKRERFLKTLSSEELFKYRVAVSLKFIFVAVLIGEVVWLQR
jgi:hypothetical protein